ncbi:unnamed protein product [Caenorhabditis sp. 36 PRJEB53466]|nr:unnamed protein product [Caenorhabditis sp. 36 PRJEB53466]
MNRLLEYGSVESIPFYNCSWKTQSEWFETGLRRPWLGYSTIPFGVLIEMIYILVVYIIFKTKLIRYPCYKIIVLLAIVDMTATVCSCLISGPLYIQGAVFCSYPTFLYMIGTIALAVWCTSCACTFCLFLNRIVNITLPQYSDVIEAKLAYASILACIFYFFYLVVFTPTVCFNSLIMAWLPDPFSEREQSEAAADYYRNTIQAWNNWIFVSSMIVFYGIYFVKVKKIARGQNSKASMAIFVQCAIICFFNTICALVYNSFTLITPAPWILLVGQVFWSINHGCPALIYITMNETIKKEFKRLVFGIAYTRKIEDTNSTTNPTRSKI